MPDLVKNRKKNLAFFLFFAIIEEEFRAKLLLLYACSPIRGITPVVKLGVFRQAKLQFLIIKLNRDF